MISYRELSRSAKYKRSLLNLTAHPADGYILQDCLEDTNLMPRGSPRMKLMAPHPAQNKDREGGREGC